MKTERSMNAARNVLFGGMLRVYSMLVPFLMRTVILYQLGVNFLGLDSLFASILQVLNLAELGIGGIMVFSMYKPLAEGNTDAVCALMNLYKKVYRIIGLVVLVLGLALTPFLPKLVHSGVPEGISLRALYFMNLGTTVLSYWLFAYKNSLLFATQRSDVGHKIHLVLDTMQYGVAILLIFVFKNYYYYLLTKIVFQILCNIVTAVIATRMYPEYKTRGTVSDEEKKAIVQRVKDLFTAQLGGVVMNSSDAIMISAFLGVRDLAIYQNYFFIISSLRASLEVVLSAATAGIGNSLVTETKEKNFTDFRKLTFMFCYLSGLCCSILLCLYQPFMTLWVGDGDLLLPMSVVVSFVIYLYVYEINRVTNIYKDAAGIWHEDRFRPLTASVVNIALNALTIRRFRFFGVIFSTVIATVGVQFPWLMHNLFRLLFPRQYCMGYVRRHALYAVVTAVSCAASYGLCSLIHIALIPTLIVRGVIAVAVTNVIFLAAYRRTEEFRMSMQFVDKVTHGKIAILKKLCGPRRGG